MENLEYKAAYKESGLTNLEWCELLGISLSSHKKYSSGDREVMLSVQKHIKALQEIKRLKALIDKLSS